SVWDLAFRDLLLAARPHASRGDRDPRPSRLPAGLLGTARLAVPLAGDPGRRPRGAWDTHPEGRRPRSRPSRPALPGHITLLARALDTASQWLERAVQKRAGVPEDLAGQLAAFLDALPFDEDQRIYWRIYLAYRDATAAHSGGSHVALR